MVDRLRGDRPGPAVGRGRWRLRGGRRIPSPRATLAAALRRRHHRLHRRRRPSPTTSPPSTLRPEPAPSRHGPTRSSAGRHSARIAARFGTTVRVLIDLNDIETRRASPSVRCSNCRPRPGSRSRGRMPARARVRARPRAFLTPHSRACSALAAAAVRGDEAAGLDLGDPGAAARARLAALVVDGEEVADLLLERRRDPLPQHLDRVGERRSRRRVQRVDLLGREGRALAERQEPGRVEDLVAVGVADARRRTPGCGAGS